MASQEHPGSSAEIPKIILFGDSLTEWSFNEWDRGFGYELEQRYKGTAEVLNRGIMLSHRLPTRSVDH